MSQLIYLSMAKSLVDYAKYEFPFATRDKPYVNCQEYYCGIRDACDFIKNGLYDMNSVDAVPVVRCGECRYYKAVSLAAFVCCHPGGAKFTSYSDYCSLGERCTNQSADVRNMDGGAPNEP